MEGDYTANSQYLTSIITLKAWENVLFKLGSERVKDWKKVHCWFSWWLNCWTDWMIQHERLITAGSCVCVWCVGVRVCVCVCGGGGGCGKWEWLSGWEGYRLGGVEWLNVREPWQQPGWGPSGIPVCHTPSPDFHKPARSHPNCHLWDQKLLSQARVGDYREMWGINNWSLPKQAGSWVQITWDRLEGSGFNQSIHQSSKNAVVVELLCT